MTSLGTQPRVHMHRHTQNYNKLGPNPPSTITKCVDSINYSLSKTNFHVILQIRPYSKSQQGGLLEGDVVLAINGVSTRGLTHATSTGLTECNAQKLALHVLRSVSTYAILNYATFKVEIRFLLHITSICIFI